MHMKLHQQQRVVICVTDEQKRRIENWVSKNHVTLTEFGRAALTAHVKNMRKMEQQQSLADTCRLFQASDSESV